MIKDFFGYLALSLGLICRIPQIYKSYKTKSVKDLSMTMFFIHNASYVSYIIYGILIEDPIHVLSAAIGTIQNCIIICMFFRYRNVQQENGEIV